MMRRIGIGLWIVVLLSWGAGARAQPLPDAASDEEKAAASAAYQEGKAAYEAGDFAAALDAFNRSHASVRSPNTQLMVARSLRDLGRNAEARAAYETTLAESDEAGQDKYGAAADSARAELSVLPTDAPPTEPQAVSADASVDAAEFVDTDEGEGDSDNPLESRAQSGLTLGAKVGGGIGAPVSDFGGTFSLELEVGLALPLGGSIGHSLGIFASGQYTQPKLDGSEEDGDPRLPGDGMLEYDVTQQLFALSLGLIYRIPVGSDLVMPYLGAGGRMYMLKTQVNGQAGGEEFGQNDETRMQFGLLAMGGVELYVGPGALLGELSFSWAKVDGFVLRDTAVGGLGLAVGYRFIL